MDRHRLKLLAWGFVIAIPAIGGAQAPVAPTPDPVAAPNGVYSSDIIAITGSAPGVPLRHGSVLSRSEEVQLSGRSLVAGTDYVMDYAAGVVYLMRAARQGDTLSVSYRYAKNATETSSTSTSSMFNGVNGFKFDLMPGALNMRFGFGLAERGADGSVMRSNLYGWNNTFSFGGNAGGLNGLLLFGDRQAVSTQSNFEATAKKGKSTAGRSKLILQNLSTNVLGGKFSADYQDVSKNFTGFGAAAGYDQKVIDQLQKEKGLTRQGFGLTDVALGGLKFSDTYKTVSDGTGGITWRTLGLNGGGLKFDWSSQRVDPTFSRFSDLGEANSKDLQRSVGMNRQQASLGLALKGGGLSFSNLDIEDHGGGHIYRREASLAVPALALNFGDSQTQKQFQNYSGLFDAEKASYGADGGLRRQWATMKLNPGHGYSPMQFAESWIKSDTGDFKAEDATAGGKGWSLNQSVRKIDKGFVSFGSINPTDTDASINAIAKMYGPKVVANAPGERGLFASSAGLERSATSLSLAPAKGVTLDFGKLDLKGQTDKGSLESLAFNSAPLTFNYRFENLGAKFDELTHMMSFERANLGTIEGLDRTDLSGALRLGHGRELNFNELKAGSPTGDAERQVISYQDKKLQVSINDRSVAPGFTRVNELVDPENTLLATLVGFKQNQTKINFDIMPGLKFEGQYFDQSSFDKTQFKDFKNSRLGYDSKHTSFGYSQQQQHSSDPLSLLFANSQESFFVRQDIGAWGKVRVEEDRQSFDGKQTKTATGETDVDFTRRTVGLEVKVDKSTSLATEQSNTDYANGQTETQRTDSVTTTISKRAGVTLSDTQLNRASDQTDQTKRNYGFWYDLGKGFIVSYGYIRQLDTSGTSTLNNVLAVGQVAPGAAKSDGLGALNQGNVGGIAVGGGYGTNQWESMANNVDATRTQSFSNVRVNTAKPLAFGPIKDFKFNFNLDTAADNFNWIRENRQFGFSGKYLTTGFGFDYHGQIDPTGDRAVDRTFTFTTDASDKRLISGHVLYKVRTLPHSQANLVHDQSQMIRDFGVTLRPTNRISLSNQLMTNPEVLKSDAMLGSVTQGSRVNRWKLDYKSTKDTSFGGSWEELVNEDNKSVGQTSGISLTLFGTTSPLTLFYGFEEVNGNVAHRVTERWSIKFDQRAGPHQSFSLFVGDLSYGYVVPTDQAAHNWTARLDYTFHF